MRDTGFTTELARLQVILLFRELEFPLAEIKSILDSPAYDRRTALNDQRELLKLRQAHIARLIDLTENILNKGDSFMDFNAFDDSKEKEYAEEAKKRWGETAAWREFEEKKPGKDAADGLLAIFAELGKLRGLPADGPEAGKGVLRLKNYITDNFYECTDVILAGLGEMYAADPRFKASIDKAGGEGTAEFVSKAIAAFCKKS